MTDILDLVQTVEKRIKEKGVNWAFTAHDFADCGPARKIIGVFHQLVREEFIRHATRTVYYYPDYHPMIGICSPSSGKVLKAIERWTGERIWPTGASAANMTGMCTQVPAKPIYVTTGKPRNITFLESGYTIQLQEMTMPRTLKRPIAYLVLAGIDNLGPRIVDQREIDIAAKHLTPEDKMDIEENLSHIQDPWLSDIARQLIAWEKPSWVRDPDDPFYSN